MMALGRFSSASPASTAIGSHALALRSMGGLAQRPLWVALAGALVLAGCQTASNVHDFDDVDRAMGSEANISSLSSVVNQNPSDASGYNVRGTALGRAGRYDQALADFNRAIEINPGFYQAYSNRALVQRKLNQNGQALSDYNRSIEINPSYNEAYVGRGNLYRSQGQIDMALADFSKAIELEPTDPKAYNNRALIYQGQGRHNDAIADFTASMTYAPNAVAPHLGRGLSYLATRRLQGSARRLQRRRPPRQGQLPGLDQPGPGAGKAGRARRGLRRLQPRPYAQFRLRPSPRRHAPHGPRQLS